MDSRSEKPVETAQPQQSLGSFVTGIILMMLPNGSQMMMPGIPLLTPESDAVIALQQLQTPITHPSGKHDLVMRSKEPKQPKNPRDISVVYKSGLQELFTFLGLPLPEKHAKMRMPTFLDFLNSIPKDYLTANQTKISHLTQLYLLITHFFDDFKIKAIEFLNKFDSTDNKSTKIDYKNLSDMNAFSRCKRNRVRYNLLVIELAFLRQLHDQDLAAIDNQTLIDQINLIIADDLRRKTCSQVTTLSLILNEMQRIYVK
jgi:hypothetical protein